MREVLGDGHGVLDSYRIVVSITTAGSKIDDYPSFIYSLLLLIRLLLTWLSMLILAGTSIQKP